MTSASALKPQFKDIERNVWFYRIFTKQDGDAIERLDPAAICDAVAKLSDPYMNHNDGSGVVCRVVAGKKDRLEMLKIRWTDHPGTWDRSGATGELSLKDDEALRESTHVRFFDNNIVGIDVNRHGPWPTTLREYLQAKVPWLKNFDMEQIPDKTALERLSRINKVKSVELRLSSATLKKIPSKPDTYMDDLKRAPRFGNAGVIEIAWKRLGKNDELNAQALKALVRYLIERSNDLDEQAQIVMKGVDRSGASESFNLKRGYIVVPTTMARAASTRRVDTEDAFKAINAAYNKATKKFPAQKWIKE